MSTDSKLFARCPDQAADCFAAVNRPKGIACRVLWDDKKGLQFPGRERCPFYKVKGDAKK